MSMRRQARTGNTYNGKECIHGHGTLRYSRTKTCVTCNRERNVSRYKSKDKQHHNDYMKDRRRRDPRISLIAGARQRAKKHGIKFNLYRDEISIPDICPVLGIPIEQSKKRLSANSPSLDQIVPRAGYVKGNVRVISYRANYLKADATLDELEALVADARRIRG